MRIFVHNHRAVRARSDGVHVYRECRCGARRTSGPNWSFMTADVRPGWPSPGGWMETPARGWPREEWAAGGIWPAGGYPQAEGYPTTSDEVVRPARRAARAVAGLVRRG